MQQKKNERAPMTARHLGLYCASRCGNIGCRYNIRKAVKDERIEIRAMANTDRCEGWRAG